MDSDDSNAESSVSNSSSSSTENSRSSTEPVNEITNAPNIVAIDNAEERELSRTNSRCSNHSSSKSDFNSSSSSSSSDNENDGIKSPQDNLSNRSKLPYLIYFDRCTFTIYSKFLRSVTVFLMDYK